MKLEIRQGPVSCNRNQVKERVVLKETTPKNELLRARKSKGQKPYKQKSADLKLKLNQSFLNWGLESVHCEINEIMDELLAA